MGTGDLGPSPVAVATDQPRRAAGVEWQRRVGSWAEAPEPSWGSLAPRPRGRGCPILGLMMLPEVWEHPTATGWPKAGGTATTWSSEETGSRCGWLSPIRDSWAALLPPLGSICLDELSPPRALAGLTRHRQREKLLPG